MNSKCFMLSSNPGMLLCYLLELRLKLGPSINQSVKLKLENTETRPCVGHSSCLNRKSCFRHQRHLAVPQSNGVKQLLMLKLGIGHSNSILDTKRMIMDDKTPMRLLT